jgi:hypothetical protein
MSDTLYGIPIGKVSGWWNKLAYSTKRSYMNDLHRLGMSSEHDAHQYATYRFGNLCVVTQRAITKLYVEKHGDN